MKDKRLLPCPFCGGTDLKIMGEDNPLAFYYFVKCQNPECNCEIHTQLTVEEAIRKWNTRKFR